MIKFYHKEGCGVCKVAQLKMDLKKIEYEDILVAPTAEDSNFAYLLEKGVKAMPALELENGEIITGAAVSKWANAYEVQA